MDAWHQQQQPTLFRVRVRLVRVRVRH